MLRPEHQSTLISVLPSIACTPTTGADAMLKAIRGYTVEEIVTAAVTTDVDGDQALAILRALSARFDAKAARRTAKEAA